MNGFHLPGEEPTLFASANNVEVLRFALTQLRALEEIIPQENNPDIVQSFLDDVVIYCRIIKIFFPLRHNQGISPAYIE